MAEIVLVLGPRIDHVISESLQDYKIVKGAVFKEESRVAIRKRSQSC